jgi:hypothetical protein
MAAQLRTTPSVSGVSVPPANAMSVSPWRMLRHASPMATADDEHATE